MYINNIGRDTTSFGSLIYKGQAKKILQAMSEKDKVSFNRAETRIEKAKFWDLILDTTKDKYGKLLFFFSFRQKFKPHKILSGGIIPYKIKENTMLVHTFDMHSNRNEVLKDESLPFRNEYIARKLKNEHKNLWEYYISNPTPLAEIRIKEKELNLLEESYIYMEEQGLISIPKKTNSIIDKIKKILSL